MDSNPIIWSPKSVVQSRGSSNNEKFSNTATVHQACNLSQEPNSLHRLVGLHYMAYREMPPATVMASTLFDRKLKLRFREVTTRGNWQHHAAQLRLSRSRQKSL